MSKRTYRQSNISSFLRPKQTDRSGSSAGTSSDTTHVISTTDQVSGAVEIQQVPREESVISATPERNPGNHNRKYQKTWKEEFPWIEYDASKDVATCSVCK